MNNKSVKLPVPIIQANGWLVTWTWTLGHQTPSQFGIDLSGSCAGVFKWLEFQQQWSSRPEFFVG